MGRNEIIAELWQSKEVNDAFAKMEPKDLQDDLKAEVFLVLMELPEEKLIGMYERKEVKFFIVRVMLNMIKSDRSNFWKKYRNFVEYTDFTKQEDTYEEELMEKLDASISGLHWYQEELFRIYTQDFNRNAKELSKATGIPYMSVVRTIKQTKLQLKHKIRNYDSNNLN